jgi:hypothetical protein
MVCLGDVRDFITLRHLLALMPACCLAGSLIGAQARNVRVSAPAAPRPNEVSITINPCVPFDPDGMLLDAHLANLPVPAHFIDGLIVRRSTDCGTTRLDSAEAGYRPPRAQQDKERLAAGGGFMQQWRMTQLK